MNYTVLGNSKNETHVTMEYKKKVSTGIGKTVDLAKKDALERWILEHA